MPAFYSQRPSASQQLPLTPPDSGSGYGYSTMHYPAQDAYVPHQGMASNHIESPYPYQPAYMQPAVAPAPPAYQYPATSYAANNTSLPPIQSYYEPVGAPTLPPLRIHDQVSFVDDYQRRLQQEHQNALAREQQQRQAAKEEKATGGVSARLDYNMDRMTDFVTEATQSIFQHNMQNQTSFRKWVHQVLAATRLPSATILLSLHYLSDRVRRLPESITPGENQIYRLLAVALVLGSKFLDDNTFINRSWSDVTAIKVLELNQLELKWLQLIRYNLHIEPEEHNGLQAWIDAWKEYDAKLVAKQTAATRLSPLDTTNISRHSTSREHRFSPYPSPYTAASSQAYGTPTSSRSAQYSSATSYGSDPWSAADRPSYEDYYKRDRYPSYSDMVDISRRGSDERSRYNSFSQGHSYYQPQAYANSSWQEPWNAAHRYDCACSACAYPSQYRPYHMTLSASAQTVMG